MLRENNGVYTLTSFSKIKNLVCGFSTVSFGNMKPFTEDQLPEVRVNQRRFLKRLGLEKPNIVTAEQIHGNRVGVVSRESSGKKIAGADGLITREEELFLMVFVADCLPIVAFDSDKRIVGIAHAGWRGTLKKIAENLIKTFIELGSKPKDISVGLGPAIEFCHYVIGEDLADKFLRAGLKNSLLRSLSGKIQLDLKQANIEQLEGAGVNKDKIDVSIKVCTYENKDLYSYRRENADDRIAAVIGMKNEK